MRSDIYEDMTMTQARDRPHIYMVAHSRCVLDKV